MEWCKLYARLPRDPKIRRAGPMAGWLFVVGMCHVTEQETDGFIGAEDVPTFAIPRVERLIAALVREGLWVSVDGGWRISQWQNRQPTMDAVQRRREQARERQSRHRNAIRNAVTDALVTQTELEVEVEEEKTPPPTPSPPEADVLEIAADADLKDYRLEQRLVAEVLELRPEWSASSVERVLRDPEVRERPWPVVVAALLIVAKDPESSVPGRVRADGPWWSDAAGARASPQLLDPPCGECGPNRQIEVEGAVARCPRCHPLRSEAS